MPTTRIKLDSANLPGLSDEAKARYDSIRDEDIDFSDIPELDEAFFRNAVIMQPGDWKKQQLTLRLDQDVIDFFKSQGRGYQTRINAVLRAWMMTQTK